jgi:hypothetical protein
MFGFIRALDPTTVPDDSTLLRVIDVNPNKYPEYIIDGVRLENTDASQSYTGKEEFTVSYDALSIANGAAFYSAYNLARDTTNATVWVNRYNLKTHSWEIVIATMIKPVYGSAEGPVYRGFTMSFKNVGADGYDPATPAISGNLMTHYYGRESYGSGLYGY